MSKRNLFFVLSSMVVILLAALSLSNEPEPESHLTVIEQIKSSVTIDPKVKKAPVEEPPTIEHKPSPQAQTQPAQSSKRSAGMTEIASPDLTLDGSLEQHIDRLMDSYRSGNLDDGYILGMNLVSCVGAPTTIDELEKETPGHYKLEGTIPGFKFSAADIEERLENKFYFCRGISQKAAVLGMELLGEAAEKGHIPSQEQYGDTYPPEDLEQYRGQLTDKELEIGHEKLSRAMKYLKNAAQHGSLSALRSLTSFNSTGFKQNQVEAFAYCLTYLEFESEYTRLDRFREIRDIIFSRMSAQEVSQAEELSHQQIQQILDHGTLFTP